MFYSIIVKMSSAPITLNVSDWEVDSIRYMQPRVSDRGAKSVSIISTQTSRSLHITSPLMMTWGISDYVDDAGVSDGRFTMTLNFPSDGYETPETNLFLEKLKEFENKILDDAVTHSETWFGEEMSREVAKHTFFPYIKYPKDKNTKKFDYSRAPSIRAKVPNYSGKWSVELYDTSGESIFPCDNENVTPVDLVPKKSVCACVLQCGGLWFGGKGWGLTWKLVQAIVKPPSVPTIFGKCHIQLPPDQAAIIDKQVIEPVDDEETEESKPVETTVDDSDDDTPPASHTPPVKKETPVEPPKPVKKKVVRKVKKSGD